MKLAAIILPIALVSILMGCSRKMKDNIYPDCFLNETTTVSRTVSCGCFVFFGQLSESRGVIIGLYNYELNPPTSCVSYNIEDHGREVTVNFLTHANHPDSIYFEFCGDVMPEEQGVLEYWPAVSGKVTLAVSKPEPRGCDHDEYPASVKLENVKFVHPETQQDTIINKLVIKDATVGFLRP